MFVLSYFLIFVKIIAQKRDLSVWLTNLFFLHGFIYKNGKNFIAFTVFITLF